ncbi:hypothetical protein Ga0058931_2493 [Roseibaca calidilacus]|uniref:PepSY domain-containing protein n=2 Tax=Roseibaca calidilacus TaxID=1666912 RepID=A0ABP2BWZ2_9RHOB|nr:hypothetical protein Ga0058931_2493 [Roseibaca calidilacus]
MVCLRQAFIAACLALCLTTQPALAVDRITSDMVSTALEVQGYKVESVTRTLLGRVRIIASLGPVWREIVLDASTGQILRDYAVEFAPSDLPNPEPGDMPRGGEMLNSPNDLPLQN